MKDIELRNRPTIGFLARTIHFGASRTLWPGILNAAVSGDANLICFPGGRLKGSDPSQAQRNVIYQQVDTDQLDGLVMLTSTLAPLSTPQELKEFHQAYCPTPIVDLAYSNEFGPSITIDGNQGMRALLCHLIEDHGYQRIALLRGSEGHVPALKRYQAYVETLLEKGLDIDERLISPASGWDKGAEAMSVLLDERGLQPGRDFEAVVAASDVLAIGAIDLLVERGIRVPTDVAVGGFNDIEEGRLVQPPLTSVSLPIFDQGQQSVEMLLAILAGKDVPNLVTLDSQLLIRQSCGCPSWSEKMAIAPETAVSQGDSTSPQILKPTQERLAAEILRVTHNEKIATTWAKRLLAAGRSDIEGNGNDHFRSTLMGMLQQGNLDVDELSAWQNTITILRSEFLPTLIETQRIRVEALFGQARIIIGEAVQRTQNTRQLQAERQSSVLHDIGQALSTTIDIEKLADVLVDRLPELGIRSAYLALYDDPNEPLSTSRLMLAYSENGRIHLEKNGRRYPSRQLIPPDVLPDRRYTLLVEPLFFQQESLGIMIFEVGPHNGNIYEVLRGYISSAIYGALLFQQARQTQAELEKRVEKRTQELEMRNVELERFTYTVSHDLKSPLITIRGFLGFLEKDALVGDMERLKTDISHIERATGHMLYLLDDLLELSRVGRLTNPSELVSFADLVDEALELVSGRLMQVGIQVVVAHHLPDVFVDRRRLIEVLQNLLDNAAKFMGDQPEPRIDIGATSKDGEMIFFVQDNGTGIAPEYQKTVFGLFERLDQSVEGTGIGLTFVKQIIEIHNGRLWIESEGVGKGTTFYFTLPISEED